MRARTERDPDDEPTADHLVIMDPDAVFPVAFPRTTTKQTIKIARESMSSLVYGVDLDEVTEVIPPAQLDRLRHESAQLLTPSEDLRLANVSLASDHRVANVAAHVVQRRSQQEISLDTSLDERRSLATRTRRRIRVIR